MIDQVDRHLEEWVNTVLGATNVSLAPPSRSETGGGVGLYLMELVHAPPARGVRRPPLQISLRYLITAWSEEPHQAHSLLGELVFAAMESPEFEVELHPIPAEIWAAFGVAPRPSFVLRVPLRQERPEPPAQLVRMPPIVQTSQITSLYGVVVGVGDVPVSGARVELPALHLSTRTDAKGQFGFSTVPAKSSSLTLRVSAKGREFSVPAGQYVGRTEALVIRIDEMEG